MRSGLDEKSFVSQTPFLTDQDHGPAISAPNSDSVSRSNIDVKMKPLSGKGPVISLKDSSQSSALGSSKI